MSDPQNPSRRKSIKYLIGGAVAAGCPAPLGFAAEGVSETRLVSENNALCSCGVFILETRLQGPDC